MPKKEEAPPRPWCPECKGIGKVSYPDEEYIHTNGQKYYGVTRPCPRCTAPAAPVAPPPDGAKRAAGDLE